MPKLILIRHGQTEWNLKKRYCGFKDLGINSCGKKQVKKLSRRFEQEIVHKVYSSDRKRAIQTAKIIFKDAQIKILPQLREIHFGIFEGMTHSEILSKHQNLYLKWLENPYSVKIPKGESLDRFQKRITCALNKIIYRHDNETVAIVCHGGVISIFLNSIAKKNAFWKHIPDSASICVVDCKDKKYKISIFNDTRHLDG